MRIVTQTKHIAHKTVVLAPPQPDPPIELLETGDAAFTEAGDTVTLESS